MTKSKKIILFTSSLLLAVAALFFAYGIDVWTVGIEEEQNGLQQGISRSAATDCPTDLPSSATDIDYAYHLYWQGGCSITRYRLPTGDLKKQAETHLRAPAPWIALDPTTKATVPEHRFLKHRWFDPASISTGYESSTSGILWDLKYGSTMLTD
jgi:hypothetical protein